MYIDLSRNQGELSPPDFEWEGGVQPLLPPFPTPMMVYIPVSWYLLSLQAYWVAVEWDNKGNYTIYCKNCWD